MLSASGQSRTAVTAYFLSKQLLLFAFVGRVNDRSLLRTSETHRFSVYLSVFTMFICGVRTSAIFTSAKVGYVFGRVRLSVLLSLCLSVRRITSGEHFTNHLDFDLMLTSSYFQ